MVLELLSGSIAGIPITVAALIPLIIGIVLGYFAKKAMKWAIIAGIIVAAAIFFGIFSFGSVIEGLKTFGPEALAAIALLAGILPLGIGFGIGFAIGFFVLG